MRMQISAKEDTHRDRTRAAAGAWWYALPEVKRINRARHELWLSFKSCC